MTAAKAGTEAAIPPRGYLEGGRPAELGDFTTSPRVVLMSAIAVLVGLVGTGVAYVLLHLIDLFTNIFFFGRIALDSVEIPDGPGGPALFLAPIAGGLTIGLIARFGSDRIRGHGIPEAIEAILINGSRVQPRVALLKPLSSAIAIGSGGPFGSEGPIILTGGAFGSLVGQVLHISSIERRILLVAGGSAGMAATFAAPVASVLLGVELLLFEWKPRSFIPVAIASATAATARHYVLEPAPLFPVSAPPGFLDPLAFMACVFVGLTAGGLSMLMTAGVYASEDAFHRLPVHWMWWPAIGGVVVGAGGLAFPEALGVGYPVIRELLSGDTSLRLVVGVLVVKSVIWAVSLGSGTSGGVLAPLLMMGCALGALEGRILPFEGPGFWPLVAMGAVMGGTMRSPLTAVVFVLELTHSADALLPVLIAVAVAHGVTVLFLRRSILTEKVSRRGLHLGREYAPDPVENVLVGDVMELRVPVLAADASPADAAPDAASERWDQPLYPILGRGGELVAVIAGHHLRALLALPLAEARGCRFGDLAIATPVVACPGESLRVVADRMAESGHACLPVVEPGTRRFLGMVTLRGVLQVRGQRLDEERRRERAIAVTLPALARRQKPAATPETSVP